jgi:hypothetical protein
MIRLVVLALFLILFWLLVASGFERRRKIVLGLLLVGLAVGAFLIEGYDKRELTNLIDEAQVQSCGITAKHTYRTNFDLELCVQNLAETGSISRLEMAITAQKCTQNADQPCLQIDRVIRDIPVKIAAKSQVLILQNLSFRQVNPNDADVQWTLEILSTKATRK